MFKFLDLEPESFGLDISDMSLKIVRLKKKGRFLKLASWGEQEIRKGIIEDGEIKYEDALIKEIEKAVQKVKGEKLNTKNVIVSLPEKKAFLQVIKMPKMEEKELKNAVFFEAENHIPFSIEKVYLDYQVVSSHDLEHFNVLIAATPKDIVDSYFSCLKKAKLIPQALEIESQSIVRALIKDEFSNQPVLVIDFGGCKTSFIIFYQESIVLTSSASFCSEHLTQGLADSLGVDFREAERLKIKYGFEPTKIQEAKKIINAMKPILDNVADQIKKYIIYYKTHNNNKKITKILLCGRGANLKGFPEFLSYELKIPTEIANPWVNILPQSLNEVPELPFKESIGYTTALGLALRGIKND